MHLLKFTEMQVEPLMMVLVDNFNIIPLKTINLFLDDREELRILYPFLSSHLPRYQFTQTVQNPAAGID